MGGFKYQKILSISITLAIILGLIFSGPASAVIVKITVPTGSETPDEGEIVSFKTSIDIEDIERIFVHNLTLSLTNTLNTSLVINCTFDVNGTKLTACENLTISAANAFTIAYGELIAADRGINYSFGYGPGIPFINGNNEELAYDISWSTPPVEQNTDYIIDFIARIGNLTDSRDFMMQQQQRITVLDTTIPLENNTTVEEDNTKIIVPSNNDDAIIDIPEGTTNISLDFGGNVFNNGTKTEVSVNGSINVTVNATASTKFAVSFPKQMKISADASDSWDGKVLLPEVKSANDINIVPDSGYTATVSKVVEIGYPDIKLVFDKPVRLLFKREAGKDIGYSRSNIFYKIVFNCVSDSENWAQTGLTPEGECKIDVGSDLVVWTKHFTLFSTYTQTQSGSGTGGSGSSGGSIGAKRCTPDWDCTEWSACRPDGIQTRECKDLDECSSVSPPSMKRHCVYEGTDKDTYWKDLGWEEEKSSDKIKETQKPKEEVTYNENPTLTGFSILEPEAEPKDNAIFIGATILLLIVIIALFIGFLPKKR
jgi:hypothetical protein